MIRNNSINHKKSNIRGNNQDIYIFLSPIKIVNGIGGGILKKKNIFFFLSNN